ncbi:tyrosine-type recombinase/integrase [Candidatus Ruminimicrobium bovinum]|uniref:tyrosine-type recombinase/integrase n=1 Tax=Candidatus Ruminimicrobium bovinum TaxID=3242779 RepID=UPI0039B8580C
MKKESNEKIIRNYSNYLIDSKGVSINTKKIFLRSIRKFNEVIKNKQYSKLTVDNIIEAKNLLNTDLSKKTFIMYMKQLYNFYEWLSNQKGFKSLSDKFEYFNLSRKDKKLEYCNKQEFKEYPTLDYVKKLVNSIPNETDKDKRDRALISFLYLTGVRVDALVSLSMQCIDIDNLIVKQYPRFNTRTKFGKTIVSKIFHFDNELVDIFVDWYNYLKDNGFKKADPLFPKMQCIKDTDNLSFKRSKLSKEFISGTGFVKILTNLCKERNITYYSPHRYRDLAINLILSKIPYGEEIKIVSQNFGHSDIATTIDCYGSYNPNQLVEKLKKLDNNINDVKFEHNLEVIEFGKVTEIIKKVV